MMYFVSKDNETLLQINYNNESTLIIFIQNLWEKSEYDDGL